MEDVGPCVKRLKVEVPAPAVEAETARVVQGLAKRAKVPGFRKGKVPKGMILKRFRGDIDQGLIDRHHLLTSHYEGPTGIVGVMLEACREIGIPAVSLWAATPHYLAANPNPKAMLALLDKAADVMAVDIDTAELSKVADEFESRVNDAMARSDEFTEYVQRLEAEDTGQVDPTVDGDQLVSEIEDFLRDRD